MSVEMVELSVKTPEPVRPAGILQQNRVFLDFFWDIAKPDQDVRLKAVEGLIKYLKTNNKEDELEYTFKRLVDGLSHTREAARPGFSLALGQVLSAFEDISLQSILSRIKEKHNLQSVKKKLLRNALFGNMFGVLSLQQSGRLSKEPPVVLGCVQLLQNLSQHRQHVKDLPSKTMMDILNEISEEVFEEVLLSALQTDLASAFRTPEQLQLLLVALQRFPQTLKPKKLKKLLGSSTIINADNIPKLTEVLKMAAHSVKKEHVLPAVALDLLKLSLKEDSFQLFWNDAIANGMFKEQSGPTHYLSFRLLGAALPLLSEAQLKEVLSGEVMMHYGEHVVSAQKPDRFKLAPEMEVYVSDFLQGCQDSDKQLAAMVGFSSLTHQGYPVVPSVWRVVQHLQPAALQNYVDWLKKMFLQPQLDKLLDFSTRKQKDNKEGGDQKESSVFRLRKWIIARLASIIDNHQVKRQEDLIMDIARFVFFHAFFSAKKASAEIPETERKLSVPLDDKTRAVLVNSFFGLLLSMHHLPLNEDSPEGTAVNQKRVLGVTADGTMWIYHLVQYAQVLLNQPKHVQSCKPFSAEQRQAWDSMIESVAALKKRAKKGQSAESGAFQQLFLLVGMHLFKAPDELLDIMKDLQSCMDKAQEKKAKKKKKKPASEQTEEEEPEWVEVMVDILLSLLSQQSRHIRQVCKTVFSSICPHVTAAALTAILDVLDPDKDNEEDGAVVITDDDKTQKKKTDEDEDEDMEDESDASDDDLEGDEKDDDNDEDEEEEEDDDDDDEDDLMEAEDEGEVDQNFRLELMKVLQQQNALATEEDGSSDEDLDDEAMMELDKGLAALFSEQKKKNQAKKDEKAKLQKEKMLVRDFKIKVLDLVEVFVARQAGSPLVLGLVEPLLAIIDRGMSSDSDQQEQDFLRRAADIFRNQLCRSKVYCRTVGDRQGELHDLLDKLMTKAQKLSDSSVCLYYFSASLYVVKVLRGAPAAETKDDKAAPADLRFVGNMDLDRVSAVFRDALSSFMSRRKSPLTSQMFTDLFSRFPVLCVNLLDAAVQHITSGVRVHQQGQACVLVLRAMQSREAQQLLSGEPWTELCAKVAGQLAVSLQQVGETESKVVKEKVVKTLELCQFLVKHVHQQKMSVDLEPLQKVLQSLTDSITFKKTGKLEDTYWAVMKHFGVMKPKVEKTKADKEADQQQLPKKKKGFLPETKKRKKRNKPVLEPAAAAAADNLTSTDKKGADKGQAKKKHDKKTKQKRPADGVTASQPNPAKKSKAQSESAPAKKKKKKNKQKKEGGGSM
ncbi:myb-binding protein 1A-like protein isoform X2 [Cheilinus undulatus]|uniref:myb-binding protein 1A-like protein isoform X2 n=1 Tax=Cheilinus undulatus TaxID=241271 RepID=UPI001BD23434|nr:myb-binding protein 1A-like protein isoform X2 [Cheilinus undulatus]